MEDRLDRSRSGFGGRPVTRIPISSARNSVTSVRRRYANQTWSKSLTAVRFSNGDLSGPAITNSPTYLTIPKPIIRSVSITPCHWKSIESNVIIGLKCRLSPLFRSHWNTINFQFLIRTFGLTDCLMATATDSSCWLPEVMGYLAFFF